jgi:hypothetical protein
MTSRLSYRRAGLITVELLVSAVLLVCMIGVFTPLTVRTHRLLNDGRQVRLAMSELSSQIDLLTSYDIEQLRQSLEELMPSEQIKEALPGARLSGQVKSDVDGSRLILTLDWDRPVKSQPLSMVAWIKAAASDESQVPTGRSSSTEDSSL